MTGTYEKLLLACKEASQLLEELLEMKQDGIIYLLFDAGKTIESKLKEVISETEKSEFHFYLKLRRKYDV